MLKFPDVPVWWENGSKFMKLNAGFREPDDIVGFDTESCKGEIISQQFVSHNEIKIIFCNTSNAFDNFLYFLESLPEGFIVVYCFNAKFDLAIVMRKFIDMFLRDDFQITNYNGWRLKVFCSRNWHATFIKGKKEIRFLDIMAFFSGSLDKVSRSFGLEDIKLKRPKLLGYKNYKPDDRQFIKYAMMDAKLCYDMGVKIIEMHKEFDIPLSSSSANFAEKVFRRKFMEKGDKLVFPPFRARRYAEITYHGGKNNYYYDSPRFIHGCYEYDFNAAYGSAMYELPSFVGAEYKRTKKFDERYVGVYQFSGTIQSCPYGILYDNYFKYYRLGSGQRDIRTFATSYELAEAIRSKEFTLNRINEGYILKPAKYAPNPIHEYIKYFHEKKNKAEKGTVNYLFYKLLLNSLYGKWIQRNPVRQSFFDGKADDNNNFEWYTTAEKSGGLYHPFIASLVTGAVRAKLHKEEHLLDAIECSTDSVKSRVFHKPYTLTHSLGAMQMESHHCSNCGTKQNTFDGLFIRNRLNILMCPLCDNIMKSALHGFWGKPELIRQLWKRKSTDYQIERMPLIREGLVGTGKPLFSMIVEDRNLNVDWSKYQEIL